MGDLRSDFRDNAMRYLQENGYSSEGGMSQGGADVTQPVTSGTSMFNDHNGNKYNSAEAEIQAREESVNLATHGLSGQKGLGNSTLGIDNSNVFINTVGKDYGIFKSKPSEENWATLETNIKKDATANLKASGYTRKEFSDGTYEMVPVNTDAQIESLASAQAAEQVRKLRDLRSLHVKTLNALDDEGVKYVQDENGVPVTTPEERKAIEISTGKDFQEGIHSALTGIYKGDGSTMTTPDGNVIDISDRFSTGDAEFAERFKDFPHLKELMSYERGIKNVYNKNGLTPRDYDNKKRKYVKENSQAVQEELSRVKRKFPIPQSAMEIETFQPQSFNEVSYFDHIAGENKKVFEQASANASPRSKYMEKLNGFTKEFYGSKNYSSDMIPLDNIRGTDASPYNEKHNRISDYVRTRSGKADAAYIYQNGKNIRDFDDALRESHKEVEGGVSNDDFASQAQFEPEFFYVDSRGTEGKPYNIYIKGHYYVNKGGKNSKPEEKSQKPFDIDVTSYMLSGSEFFSGNEQRRLLVEDGIIDKVHRASRGTPVQFTNDKINNVLTENHPNGVTDGSPLGIVQDPTTGMFNLYGNIVDWNLTEDGLNEAATIKTINEDPNKDVEFKNLSEDNAKQMVLNYMMNNEAYSEAVSLNKGTTTVPMVNAYTPIINSLQSSGVIESAKDIGSFDVGLFQINDNDNFAMGGGKKQYAIGFRPPSQQPLHPTQMNELQQTEYAARLVANTDEGWNNFNSVVNNNQSFKDDVTTMQNIIKDKGKITTSTPSLINDLKKNFNFTENHISSMYMHFDSSQLNNYFDQINPGIPSGAKTYNDAGIPDWLYALVVMKNESDGNPNAINAIIR